MRSILRWSVAAALAASCAAPPWSNVEPPPAPRRSRPASPPAASHPPEAETPPPSLTERIPEDEAARLRGEIADDLERTEIGLRGAEEDEISSSARRLGDAARRALEENDLRRASNLARKARRLAEDVGPRPAN